MVRITRARIDLARLVRAARDPAAGAVVTFLGTTRNQNVGRKVIRLEYEAYATMAEREMRRLATRATRRWRLRKVAIEHRIGVVPVGETSVAIVVAAGHRAEAFAACHWLIDTLKVEVPIWKREHFRGGRVWIGMQSGGPPPARRRRAPRPRATTS
jgi:molybdopterin synthase catalytic subunit